MTPNQAREIILTRAITVLGALDPAVPYIFDNEDGEFPGAAAGTACATLLIRETPGGQETLGPSGGRKYVRNGVASLLIYAPRDNGTQRADAIAKAWRDGFEGVTLNGIPGSVYFTDCQLVEMGVEGPWWRVNALSAFWFEERK